MGSAEPAAGARDERYLGVAAERVVRLIWDRLDEEGYEPKVERPAKGAEELDATLSAMRTGELGVEILAQRFGLGELDLEILLLGAATEVFTQVREAVGQWPGVPGYKPTLRMVQDLWGPVYGPATIRARFGPDSPLLSGHLVEFTDHQPWDDSTSAAESEFQVPDRVVRFLLGERGFDSSLGLYARLAEPTVGFEDLHMPRRAPDALRALIEEVGLHESGGEPWWGRFLRHGPLLVVAMGPLGSGRFALCEAAAKAMGYRVIEVDMQALGNEGEEYGPYLNRLLREATLQRAMPVFVNCGRFVPDDDFDEQGFWILSRKLERFGGPAGLCLDKPLNFDKLPANRRIFRADLDVPPAVYRKDIWLEMLPEEGVADDVDVWTLAKIFNFGGGGIQELLREATVQALTRGGPSALLTMEDLMSAGREIQSRRMGKLTRRMLPKTTLDDLIVPPRVRKAIEEIISTIRLRHIVLQDWGFGEKISTGKGMSALFSGPPGTGKSMAAKVISRECGMNLFRVNLAMVVSKWVGETEERLAKLFEQAKESHSILLFDEADALFAKRSKVKSAQDKYANLEVNFLLQEVESFEGVVILTTNLEAMIDKAFKRRINFRVYFPKPDPELRLEIWKAHMPPKAPFSDDIDWRALAEDFDFTGGYIKNAMLRAAQRAAEQDGIITHELLCQAAEAEMAETGRVIRETYS